MGKTDSSFIGLSASPASRKSSAISPVYPIVQFIFFKQETLFFFPPGPVLIAGSGDKRPTFSKYNR